MSLARQFLVGGNVSLAEVNCDTAVFHDPTQYVLDQIRQLAFRTAVAAGNMTDMQTLFFNSSLIDSGISNIRNWTQQVSVTQDQILVVYTISFPYLICAIIASLLAVAGVAPLYWRAWGLSRPYSFNPLEVANAFDAPLLAGLKIYGNGKDVAQQAGQIRVRYVNLGSTDSICPEDHEGTERIGLKARFVPDESL